MREPEGSHASWVHTTRNSVKCITLISAKIHEYKKNKLNQVTGKMGLTTLAAHSTAGLLNITSMLSHS